MPAFSNLSVNEEIIVRLKWGQTEYKGRLVSVDSYMNIQLTGTEEFIDHKSTGQLGQVLIRYAFNFKSSYLCVLNIDFACGFFSVWIRKRLISVSLSACSRCNNVLWIQGSGGGKDSRMEE